MYSNKKENEKMSEEELAKLPKCHFCKQPVGEGLSPHCWICLSVTNMLNMPFEELLAKLRKDHAKKLKVMLDKETIEHAEKHNIDINEAVKQHTERLKAKAEN